MHVAVNALYLRPGGVGGTERYLSELLARLPGLDREIQWSVFVCTEGRDRFSNTAKNLIEISAPSRASARVRRSVVEQTWLRRKVRGADVLWNPGATFVLACRVPQVTTVHDCQWAHFPAYFGAIERAALSFHLNSAAAGARALIVPSQTTARDVCDFFGAVPEKIKVVAEAAGEPFRPDPGADDEAVRRKFGLREQNYFLCVASSLPHKRLDLLVEAYRLSGSALPLVWCGSGDPEKMHALARGAGVGEKVRILGWVPLSDIPALYRGARAAVLTSEFEGFGLAALEALACGTPLLSTPCDAVYEVVGEAALLADGFQPTEIAEKLRLIADDEALRERLRAAGPARAAEFSWDRSAEQTLAALRKAAYE